MKASRKRGEEVCRQPNAAPDRRGNVRVTLYEHRIAVTEVSASGGCAVRVEQRTCLTPKSFRPLLPLERLLGSAFRHAQELPAVLGLLVSGLNIRLHQIASLHGLLRWVASV